MDLTKLTPAPWVAQHRHVHGTEADDELSGLGWEVDGPPEATLRGTYAKAADAQFIVLARNALDVMLRRGWGVERVGGKWFLAEHGFPKGIIDWGDGFDDPFTCLVTADAWYTANVEGAK